MVEEYEDRQITRRGHNGTRYVLASDYAALEAERDEWKRRCENIVTALGAKGFSAEFLARIAEGRDNG